jgi:nucleoside-diphosphate-sugar epimerase
MKALVTGGGGFLGRAIVESLLSRGDSVRILARGEYRDLAAMGVDVIRGDIVDYDVVVRACAGCDTVFHVAAKAGIWGREDDYHRTNVIGTQNVIDSARGAGVGRLVYTSSPSVVFAGGDMAGADESAPYPSSYTAAYPRTKALAEAAVLAANNSSFATVALRPHLIWGPRDNHLVPRIIARARKLRRIGHTDPLIDSTYIDNAADAHVLAADRLAPASALAGRAYFITNGEPRKLWTLVNDILAAGDLPPVTKCVPKWFADAAGVAFELLYGMLGITREPPLTRFLVKELTNSHWFDISAARRDLGYTPRVSIDEGLLRLREWLSTSRRKS